MGLAPLPKGEVMDDRELTEKLAELIGWAVKLEENSNTVYYIDGLPYPPKWVMPCSNWQPLTNMNHLWMCVENIDDCLHLKQHGENGVWSAMFCGSMSYPVYNQDPKRAVAEALIKTMEK